MGSQPHQPLRILLVVEAAAKGTGKHVMDLSEGLIARGCDVHLLYSPLRMDGAFQERMTAMPGLTCVPITMHRKIHLTDLAAVWAVRRYLKQHGPFDVIHGHSSKGGAIARLGAAGSGVPAIYTPHALIMMSPNLPWYKRRFFSSIEFLLSKFSRYILAVSPAEARLAVTTGLGKQRVITVPNGVGKPELLPRNEARVNCGVDESDIVVGSVGRLVVNKAPDVLIEAMAIALKSAPQLRVVFLGDGPEKAPLAALAERLGIADRVRLLGEYDARKAFAAFDIFAISSRMESMPYVVLEAMAAGQPIIATVTSGVETLVEHDVNGLVVSMGDREGLAAALVTVASDPAKMAKMAAASLQRIKPFSSEGMIDKIVELYYRAGATPLVATDDDEPQLAVDME